MTTSTFGWLDHNDGERRRMLEAISLFRDKGTLDELGIGTIRDTFADHFFPGTSTIQTRARYFLFIPWIYQKIEEERVPSSRAAGRARELQTALIASLKAGKVSAGQGLIGIDAGENIQQWPSSIYWNGLRRWGIREVDGSPERYDASLDLHYREERAAKASDGGELVDLARRNWHASLPSRPADLFDKTTFDLTAQEADYLIERIRRVLPGTLLAACVTNQTSNKSRSEGPWDIGGIDRLPAQLQQDIESAELFSLALEGAGLLYNLILARKVAADGEPGDTSREDRYAHELTRWAADMLKHEGKFAAWDRAGFRARLRALNPSLPEPDLRFSEAWIEIATTTPMAVVSNVNAHTLVTNRERQKKAGRSRLENAAERKRRPGESGTGRLTFRWTNARRIVGDILRGSRRAGGFD